MAADDKNNQRWAGLRLCSLFLRETMDAKITGKRLGSFFTYEWLKIVLITAVIIVAWVVILITISTKTTPAQSYEFYILFDVKTDSIKKSEFENKVNGVRDKIFSKEILNFKTGVIDDNEYTYAKINAYYMTSQCDSLMLANTAEKTVTKKYQTKEGYWVSALVDEEGTLAGGAEVSEELVDKEIDKTAHLTQFASEYYVGLTPVDVLMTSCDEYLNNFYFGDYTKGVLDEEKFEGYFRDLYKTNKDKRYKSEKQIQEGLKEEKARLEKLIDDLSTFRENLRSGVISMTRTYLNFEDVKDQESYCGYYGLDLSGLGNMKDMFYIEKTVTSGEEEITMSSTTGINLVFLNHETQIDYQWEVFAMVNYLVDCYAL